MISSITKNDCFRALLLFIFLGHAVGSRQLYQTGLTSNATSIVPLKECKSGYGRLDGHGSCVECSTIVYGDPRKGQRCTDCHNNHTHCSTCEDFFGADGEGACRPCQPWCHFCSKDYRRCDSCIRGAALKDGKCALCAENLNFAKLNEQLCLNSCATKNCKACYPGDGLTATGGCSLCAEGCLECAKNNNICTKCAEKPIDQVLLGGKCLACPEGCLYDCSVKSGRLVCNSCEVYFHKNINGTCTFSCGKHCLECSKRIGASKYLCDYCEGGYYTSDGGKTCRKCPPGCEGCFMKGKEVFCDWCNDGYVLIKNKCTKCPPHCSSCYDGGKGDLICSEVSCLLTSQIYE